MCCVKCVCDFSYSASFHLLSVSSLHSCSAPPPPGSIIPAVKAAFETQSDWLLPTLLPSINESDLLRCSYVVSMWSLRKCWKGRKYECFCSNKPPQTSVKMKSYWPYLLVCNMFYLKKRNHSWINALSCKEDRTLGIPWPLSVKVITNVTDVACGPPGSAWITWGQGRVCEPCSVSHLVSVEGILLTWVALVKKNKNNAMINFCVLAGVKWGHIPGYWQSAYELWW